MYSLLLIKILDMDNGYYRKRRSGNGSNEFIGRKTTHLVLPPPLDVFISRISDPTFKLNPLKETEMGEEVTVDGSKYQLHVHAAYQ